jgi:hypothetical protein
MQGVSARTVNWIMPDATGGSEDRDSVVSEGPAAGRHSMTSVEAVGEE